MREEWELKVEIGLKEGFKKKLVRSRLKWIGHGERREDGKLGESTCPESVQIR